MEELVINTDGGARGNPGPAAVGVIFQLGKWQLGHERYIGEATNNIAEYQALIDALDKVINVDQNYARIRFCLDSELVVRQLNGQYKVKDAKLQLLYQRVQSQLKELKVPFTIMHVPRAENKLADKLVNHALDVQLGIIDTKL